MTVPKLDPKQYSEHLHKYSVSSQVSKYQVYRWPIRYPAARGCHNCQVLHYYLCVPNDGAKGGSRDYELLYVLDKNYLCSGYLIHGVTKYLANLLWFVPPQVTFTCLLEVTPRILMTFRGTHNPRPGGIFFEHYLPPIPLIGIGLVICGLCLRINHYMVCQKNWGA